MLRVLVGSYRRPFLASTGMLTEPSIDKLLASRRDIAQHRLDWNPRAKSIVDVTVDGKPLTVRVIEAHRRRCRRRGLRPAVT